MHWDANDIVRMMMQYLWPLVRISSVVLAVPFLGGKMIPMRIRMMFAIGLTLIIAPTITILPAVEPFTWLGIILLFQQVMIGIAIGFVFQMILQIFIISGQIISMQSGLGFASMVDPASGISVPLVGQVFMFITGLMFFSFNCHLILIETIANSFQWIPISEHGLSNNSYIEIVVFLSYVFKASMLITLPVVFSLLLINLGFGVLARAAPQLNIFAIGFPITLTISLLLIYLVLTSLVSHTHTQFDHGFAFVNHLLTEKVA